MRSQHDRDVLVENAFREAEPVPVPEGPPKELVPRRAIGEQRGEARDVGLQPLALEGPGLERRLSRPGEVKPAHVAGREVGPCAIKRLRSGTSYA